MLYRYHYKKPTPQKQQASVPYSETKHSYKCSVGFVCAVQVLLQKAHISETAGASVPHSEINIAQNVVYGVCAVQV